MSISETLGNQWELKTPRERLLIVSLVVAVLAIVLYFVVLQIQSGMDNISDRNTETKAILKELNLYQRSVANKEPTRPPVKIPDKPVNLEAFVQKITTKAGIPFPPRIKIEKNEFPDEEYISLGY